MRKTNRILALLLALVMVLQMAPVMASVSAESAGSVRVAALPVTDPNAIVWEYTDALLGSGSTAGAMDVYRDASWLYIGLRYENANTLTLSIDGKEYVYALDTAASTTVVRVKLGAEGVCFPGYDESVAFSATLSGVGGTASLAGQMYFCAAASEVIATMPTSHFKNVVGMTVGAYDNGDAVVSLDTTAAAGDDFYADTGWYTNVYNNALAAKEQRTQDILVEQTVCIEKLPVSNATTVSGYGNIQGLRLGIRDSGAANQEMWLSIHADENGDLSAVMANKQVVALGKKVGDTFKLGLQWNVDGTVKLFVDCIKLAQIDQAAALASWAITGDAVTYGYANLAGDVKVRISRPVVKAPVTQLAMESEITESAVLALFDAANPNLDKTAVKSNVQLPGSFTSAYMGNLPMHWVSSNAQVISNTGVVSLPTEDTNVTLTAFVGKQQVASVSLKVLKAQLSLTNPVIGARRTANIAAEANFGTLRFQGLSATPSGKLDAYWDDTNLYLRVEHYNAVKLDVTVGSYAVSKALSGQSGVEIVTLPLAQLGVTIQNLNQFVQLQAVLTDDAGNTSRIAQSAAKVYFAAHSDVMQNVNVYSVTEMLQQDNGVSLDKTFAEGETAYMQSSNLNVFQGDGALRSENLLLEQTVCISQLPVMTPGATDGFSAGKGLFFALCDKTTAPARADYILQGVFYADANKELSLVIGKSTTVIDLGVKLGDTFKLGVQWNTNDSVDVYVNYAYICTISSGVYVENYAAAGNSMGIHVRNITGTVKASFSDLQVRYGLPKSISDVVDQAVVSAAVTQANPDQDLNNITDHLVLPTLVDTQALGKLPIVWTSSNPDVIAPDGTVTLQDTFTSVTLTAKLGGQTVATLKVKVADRASDTDAGPHIPAFKINYILFSSFDYPATFIPAGNVSGSMGALWTSSTLYLSIKYQNATQAKITIGDYVQTVSLSGSSGTKRVDLSFSKLGISVLYSNQVVPVQVELIGSSGTARLSDSTAKIYLTVKPSSRILYFPNHLNKSSYNWDISSSSQWVLDTSSTVNTEYTDAFLGSGGSSKVDHQARNLLMQQTIRIDALPVEDFSYNDTTSNGLLMYMVDRYDVDGDGNPDGQYTYGILGSIRNAGGGNLVLHVGPNAQFKLNRKLGQTFTLGMQWNMDDTVDVYVDYVYIGSVANGTLALPWAGSDNITYNYRDLSDDVKVTLSGVAVYEGIPAANAGKLTQQGLETLFKQSNPNVDVNAVTADVVLPASYTGASGQAQSIVWRSSNEAVVSSTGKVTAQGANYVVALNAYIDDELVGKIALTVVGSNRLTISQLNAGYATDLTMDGAISENSWILNSAAMENGAAALRIGAQWNISTLYLALEGSALAKSSVEVNGVAIDLAGSYAVKNGNVAEIAIPMATLGITVRNYGQQIPVTVTVNGVAYSLTVCLSSVSWFATDNSAHRVNSEFGNSYDLADHGAVMLDDGYYIYDHYNNANVANSGTYVYYNFLKEDPTKPANPPLWPANQTYYLQFDFQATSMPVYDASVTGYDIRNSNCGVSWAVMGEREKDKQDAMSECTLFGMYNNGKNLVFVISGQDALVSFPLDKQVGDLFRVAVAVNADGDLQVFIDGELKRTVVNAEKRLSGMAPYANKGTVAFRVVRSSALAQSGADNFDVYMTNLAFGLYYGESVLDALNFDVIKGRNTDQMALTYALNLPSTYTNTRLGTTVDLTWTSSDTNVISNTGTVTRPAKSGQLVTLTAATADGDVKEIQVYVKGKNAGNTVMTIVNDVDPESSYGKVTDVHQFTLDQNNSSVVYNQGSAKPFNVVRLADADGVGRLHADLLKLYVSDNNANYTRIEDFKLLQIGRYWYLYGFEANARYVKVHCTHFNGAEADFTGVLSEMITAYYDDGFGAAGGFASTANVTLTNTSNRPKTDYPWAVDAAGLGVSFLAANCADARFYADGQLLYHYYENGKFYVRVPYVAAGGSVQITVKAGAADALDISNKEAVYEVIYGSRELTILNKLTGNRVARTLTMRDGRMIGIDVDVSGYGVVAQYSDDQGYSWTAPVKIPESVGLFNGVSGFIYDDKLDRIIIAGYVYTETSTRTNFIYSDDCGASWQYLGGTTFDGSCYVDGLSLQTNDGAGSNVDYVIGLGGPLIDDQGTVLGLQAFSAYSADGGKTWYRSEALTVEAAAGTEAGISENTVYEMADGTLVMYARWQDAGIYHFAVYYSYNHGLSWTKEPVMSEIYTVNTNPVMLDDEGTALLMWSGNTALGGNSYRRTPLNIAVSNDQSELLRFSNIQDLYAKYSLQGLDTATQNQATNPHFRIHGDKIIAVWMNNFTAVVQLHLDQYRDFIYKTKGAYDSFEGRSVEYEGWASVYGNALRTDAQAYAGSYAMLLEAGSAVARSVPSVSKGQLSMQVYVAQGNEDFTLELQTAFSNNAQATPIRLVAENGVLGGVQLVSGWNSLVFDLQLDDGKATLQVNGQPAQITVDTQIGDYICYVYMKTTTDDVYVDEFTLMDDDEQIRYAAQYQGIAYKQLDSALADAAADGEGKVTLLGDTSAVQVTVPLGVELDLNGYQLSCDALVSYGNVVDSADGKALLQVGQLMLASGNQQMPVYDTAAGGYRMFTFRIHNYGTKQKAQQVTFGFALVFDNEDAYTLLSQGGSGVSVQVKLAGTGMAEQSFVFADGLVQSFAQLVMEYPGAGAAMLLHVTGTDTLASGDKLTVIPIVATESGMTESGDVIAYTAG